MQTLGIILVVAGLIGFVVQGITYTRRSESVRLGPMEVTAEERERIPIPPILSGAAIIAGLALIIVDRSRRRV